MYRAPVIAAPVVVGSVVVVEAAAAADSEEATAVVAVVVVTDNALQHETQYRRWSRVPNSVRLFHPDIPSPPSRRFVKCLCMALPWWF